MNKKVLVGILVLIVVVAGFIFLDNDSALFTGALKKKPKRKSSSTTTTLSIISNPSEASVTNIDSGSVVCESTPCTKIVSVPPSSVNLKIRKSGYDDRVENVALRPFNTDVNVTLLITCPGPYHNRTNENTCVWSCGTNTQPDDPNNSSGQCVCQAGFTESGTDQFGRRVCAEGQPNLTAPYLSYEPLDPTANQDMTFMARVKNVGEANLDVVPDNQVELRVDVGNDGSWDWAPVMRQISSLAPGAEQEFSWQHSPSAGTLKAEVCADRNNVVQESDETDNCRSIEFLVHEAAAPPAPIAEQPAEEPIAESPAPPAEAVPPPSPPAQAAYFNFSAHLGTTTVDMAKFYARGTTTNWNVPDHETPSNVQVRLRIIATDNSVIFDQKSDSQWWTPSTAAQAGYPISWIAGKLYNVYQSGWLFGEPGPPLMNTPGTQYEFTVDPSNEIAETNENDNTRTETVGANGRFTPW